MVTNVAIKQCFLNKKNSQKIESLLNIKYILNYLKEILRIRKLCGVTSKYSSSFIYSIHSSKE